MSRLQCGRHRLAPKGTLAERLLRPGLRGSPLDCEMHRRPERDLGRKAIETAPLVEQLNLRPGRAPKGTLAERLLRHARLVRGGLTSFVESPERDLGRKAIETGLNVRILAVRNNLLPRKGPWPKGY